MLDRNDPPGILYIVATPIGNLSDISERAVKTLREVDLILAEDTRVTGRLLAHCDVKTRQASFHDHNEKKKTPEVLEILLRGRSVALVSDAGTPLISDPGYMLVRKAVEKEIDIVAVPGPSSVLAALVCSGFPSDKFCFEGYPPRTGGKLRRFFKALEGERRTIIFFESPHRIVKSLAMLIETLGDREIFIGRELTKKFEEKLRGNASELRAVLEGKKIKGEVVVIMRGHGSE